MKTQSTSPNEENTTAPNVKGDKKESEFPVKFMRVYYESLNIQIVSLGSSKADKSTEGYVKIISIL